ETGEPGLHVRLLGSGGEVVRSEHRAAGTPLWLSEYLSAGGAAVEVTASFRAAASGTHRFGVAGVGTFRLTANGSTVVDEELGRESGSTAALLFTPPQRSGELEVAVGDTVELAMTYRPT